MRIATTIAQLQSGKWECVALPDSNIDSQKKAYKKEVVANSGKYKQIRLMISKSSDKRHSFKKPVKVEAVKADKPAKRVIKKKIK